MKIRSFLPFLQILVRPKFLFSCSVISKSIVPAFPVCPIICCLNLNEALLLLLARKLITSPLAFTAGSSLYYCHKLQDVFQ